MMADKFPNFALLPPELRLYIWEFAFQADWSCTNFHRVKQRIKISGKKHHRSLGLVCREARDIMENKLTKVEGLGWFDFDRHLFFFRDLDSSKELMGYIFKNYELKSHIQHILVNPQDSSKILWILENLARNCTSIRNIIFVAPWFTPHRTGPFDMDQDFIASYEDWSRVIAKSPTELNLRPLLEALQDESAENEACISRYRMRLSQDVDRLPNPLPPPMDLNDHESWRNRRTLDSIRERCEMFGGPTRPRLFLRTREEIRNPQSIDSLWAGRANASMDHPAL